MDVTMFKPVNPGASDLKEIKYDATNGLTAIDKNDNKITFFDSLKNFNLLSLSADLVLNDEATPQTVQGSTFAIAANETVELDGELYIDNRHDSLLSLAIELDVPAGGAAYGSFDGTPSADMTTIANQTTGVAAGAIELARIKARIVNGSTAGNVALKAAQSSATAADLIVRSYSLIRKITSRVSA